MKPRRAFTAGTFDLFHHGHASFLREASLLGDVTVAVNTDEFVAAYKGPSTMTYSERAAVVAACRWVSLVVPQDSACLAPLLERVRPDYLVVGSDWARKDYYEQIGVGQDWLDSRNVKLVYVPYTAGVSSSDIRARLLRGGDEPREPFRAA